jgi:hypothetical protein
MTTSTRKRKNYDFDAKNLICVLMILATMFTICNASDRKVKPPEDYIIVWFHEYVTDECIKAFVDRYKEYGLRLRRITVKWMNIYTFWYDQDTIGLYQLVELIRKDNIVLFADPDYPMLTTSFQPNDPLFRYQWYLQNTGQTIEPLVGLSYTGTSGKDIQVTKAWTLLNMLNNNTLSSKVVAVTDR